MYIYIYIYIYIHTGAGHIIRISSKSWFISLIPFKKWNLYNVYIHSTQTDIFQVFISFNFDDYNRQLMKFQIQYLRKLGKTANLTVVQKMTIDTLHKEGKTQKVIAKEAGCSQSSVSKHINREAKGRKRCGRKKFTSNRDNRTMERIVKQNPFKNVGEIHKEWTAAGVSPSRTTTHRLMQDMGFSCRISLC